jgi:hypothetical protein
VKIILEGHVGLEQDAAAVCGDGGGLHHAPDRRPARAAEVETGHRRRVGDIEVGEDGPLPVQSWEEAVASSASGLLWLLRWTMKRHPRVGILPSRLGTICNGYDPNTI